METNSKKIKKRNLDPELVAELNANLKSGKVELADLSPQFLIDLKDTLAKSGSTSIRMTRCLSSRLRISTIIFLILKKIRWTRAS